jgi:xanthine dehydrogenase accessory factor
MFVIIKGAGDLASGIALRLHHAGFQIAMTEIAFPLAVRRTVCFSQAVFDGSARVEDVTAVLVKNEEEMRTALTQKQIALFIDPDAEIVLRFKPDALVDAIMAKKNLGTGINDAPAVIAIGPGFTAGIDCHAVIETKRGHTIGRVITEGSALSNTGIPGDIGGYTIERLLRASADGVFEAKAEIGDLVKKGDVVAEVRTTGAESGASNTVPGSDGDAGSKDGCAEAVPVYAEIDGILRGLLPSGITVTRGLKAGDIDPRCEKFHCFTVSDKALSIAGGALEAILALLHPL